ncbi:class I SAM-dependent methyltransferase [Bremerella sp. JC770]|uniref:class I SAM-dependent methyltransferase n=1 Tax=Bremerella sp. JC770 TaxID=3232137 RepID=UPI00345A4FA6
MRESTSNLFDGTARYYRKYRFAYPDKLFDDLVSRFLLTSSDTLLDLGCGPGNLAIPFAQRGVQVWAVDPSQEMLEAGKRRQQEYGVQGIRWDQGDDSSIAKIVPSPIRLCVMGSSFHWTSRNILLQTLDTLIQKDGAVVLVDPQESPWAPTSSDWSNVANEVVREFLGPHRKAGPRTYSHPDQRHEDVLGDSPFSQVKHAHFTSSIQLDIDDIIGLFLSTSFASPRQLGASIEPFTARLRQRLEEVMPQRTTTWQQTWEMLIGRRA